jgi:hypothetical protein
MRELVPAEPSTVKPIVLLVLAERSTFTLAVPSLILSILLRTSISVPPLPIVSVKPVVDCPEAVTVVAALR